jgi:hypothetical protein
MLGLGGISRVATTFFAFATISNHKNYILLLLDYALPSKRLQYNKIIPSAPASTYGVYSPCAFIYCLPYLYIY